MKNAIPILLITVGFLPTKAYSQLSNGGLYANFGVDADTRANWMKYGLVTGAVPSNDWFAPSAAGVNVIDTSNAATLLALLQGGANISFAKRMSQLLFAKVGGKLWLDAAYGRDFVAASNLKDSTTFTIAAKNGDNPANWLGGISSFPDKNDLTDVYAHMRRDGTTVHDSLWFFTAVSTYGFRGSSYFDVELYKNAFSYSATTGTFTTAGTSGGHTEWLFDAAGNITQTGDMILAVNFSPGLTPVIDLRIWVSQTTLSTITPAYFNFTGAFNGASASPTWGYASIVSKAGTTNWGAGISNFSGTMVNDTTYATPWGTAAPTGGVNWSSQYITQQFIEIGLNLTRIGVDPALYSATLSPCQSLFSDIFFKSRSSTSFTSNMQDFVVPLTFLRAPVMDYFLTPDTLRCNHKTATISVTNNSTAGYYTWTSPTGGITGSNSDSTQLSINKPGTYIVSASPAAGCPPTRTDTVVVPIDTFPPVASANAGLVGNMLALYGGNPVASNYPTPFGGSHGLSYDWSGPSGFHSTVQNPLTDTVWGTYLLTVTEKRNGCTDTASTFVSEAMFIALLSNQIEVTGSYGGGTVMLQWHDPNAAAVSEYVVEKQLNGEFVSVGSVMAGGALRFSDGQPATGQNFYRIKAVTYSGGEYYSTVIGISVNGSEGFYLAGTNLVAKITAGSAGALVVYDLLGQVLSRRDLTLQAGTNEIAIPGTGSGEPAVRIITLFVGGRMTFTQEALVQADR
ncbi:MAG TPA: hypothetical protein VGR89_05735 [Puia sp.]|nr:hypothetical protein [Puia sp.]